MALCICFHSPSRPSRPFSPLPNSHSSIVNPIPMFPINSHFYDNFKPGEKFNKRHRSIFNILKSNGLTPWHNVLEIGCGSGLLSNVISQYAKFVTAIDSSPQRIQSAIKQFGHRRNILFLQADATQYQYPSHAYDVILLPDVLEHIPIAQHNALFCQLASALKPSGFILIHIPDPLFLSFVRQHKPAALQPIDQSLSLQHIENIASFAGLTIVSAISYPIWQKSIEYRSICLRPTSHITSLFKL